MTHHHPFSLSRLLCTAGFVFAVSVVGLPVVGCGEDEPEAPAAAEGSPAGMPPYAQPGYGRQQPGQQPGQPPANRPAE